MLYSATALGIWRTLTSTNKLNFLFLPPAQNNRMPLRKQRCHRRTAAAEDAAFTLIYVTAWLAISFL
jgi:hypothetical protein